MSGGTNGIYAEHTGTGALSITASGLVQGTNGIGIMPATAATGRRYTVRHRSYHRRGRCNRRIPASGHSTMAPAHSPSPPRGAVAVDGPEGSGGDGIRARNSGSDLTINVAGVTGGNAGIRANNYGTGALSITARGAVTANGLYGYGADGIRARNSGTDLTINAAAVSGARSGIDARNAGSGALSIARQRPCRRCGC